MYSLKRILPVFSYLYHPLFIPLYAVLYWLLLDVNFLEPAQKYLLLIQVAIITVLIPVAVYFLLKSLGKIDSIMAKDLGQRKLPLIIQALLLWILLRQGVMQDRIPELYYFFWAVNASILVALAFLLAKRKISLHMMGMAGLSFFVIGLGFHNAINIVQTVAFLFVISGVVASSRLFMKAHDLTELAIGYFAGMVPQLMMWYFWV